MWGNRSKTDDTERRHRELLDAVSAQTGAVELGSASNRRWQIVAAALAALGLVFTLIIWHPWVARSSSSGARPVLRAVATMIPGSHNAFLPRQIGAVSEPPSYPSGQGGNLCELWWQRWLPAQGAAEDSSPTVEISAPASVDTAVVGASVHVYRAYSPTTVSYVICAAGGGAEPGTLLDVNLARPYLSPTIVADDGSDIPLSVPNAVINIDPGHTAYIAVTPSGAAEMYEWSVTLDIVVAQRHQLVTFGTPRQPLRSWLGTHPSEDHTYTFSNESHRWVIGA